VRYVYVDAETGEAATEEHTSWPTFNAQHFYPRAERHAASPDLVQPGEMPAFSSRTGAAARPSMGLNPVRGRSRAEDDEKLYSVMVYAFREEFVPVLGLGQVPGHAGIPTTGVAESIQHTDDFRGGTFKSRVIQVTRDVMEQAGPHDMFVLDINGHSNIDASGKYFLWLPNPDTESPAGDGSGQASNPDEMLRIEELGLTSAVACRILIIAGTCFGGHWITYARYNLDLPGKEVTVFAASPSELPGYGDLDDGEGAKNALYFREEIGKQPADAGQAGLIAAATAAVQRSKTYFHEEVTQKFPDDPPSYALHWERVPSAGEDCELEITPQTAEAGANEPIPFQIKINNRPASAPPVRIEVTTTKGKVSGGTGTGVKTTLNRPGSVTFESPDLGEAVITAEAFEGSGSSEKSIGKVTARVNVNSGAGLVYSQINGNITGTGFPQSRPGSLHEVNFTGIPPLLEYSMSDQLPPPAVPVNTREAAILLSRDIAVGTRVAILGGAVGNPIAEMTIAETETDYDANRKPVRIRERAFQAISGHVTLVKVDGPNRTVRVENVHMRAHTREFGGDGMGTPVSIDGRGTFVVNGSFTVTDTR
jgi:hypothetical protein